MKAMRNLAPSPPKHHLLQVITTPHRKLKGAGAGVRVKVGGLEVEAWRLNLEAEFES